MSKFIKEHYKSSGVIQLANFICRNFIKISSDACKEYIDFYTPPLFDSLLDHYFNGEYICNFHFICEIDHFKFLSADDYARDILNKSDIKNQYENKKSLKHVDLININATTWKVLQVSDIHTDLNYVEGTLGNCIDTVCCHESIKPPNFKFLGKNIF